MKPEDRTVKLKAKKLRKKNQTVKQAKAMAAGSPQGSVTYKLTGVKKPY